MIYTRQEHNLFLEEELRAQTEQFQHKLETSASYLLLEREELFIAQFVKIENGEMILKFSNSRGLPRKGEYLYCFTTPKQYHNYKEWGNVTYGELIKSKGFATELVCIWQSSLREDSRFCLVGFRGVDIEFAEHLEGHHGAFLILGINVPPYQYIYNLQKIVKYNNNAIIRNILDGNINGQGLEPLMISNQNISKFLLDQLTLSNSLILQGPPGTGKTYQIACTCKKLVEKGCSVLVTALTNRALIEVAQKEELSPILKAGKIHKTKLSVDESKEVPNLLNMKQIAAEPGHIVLSTFYITSGEAASIEMIQPFDVVIMDEASQALLGMFAAAKLLGKKCMFVGDYNQLPPVVALNQDRIARRSYHFYVDGFVSVGMIGNIPSYQLTNTYRLPERAAKFTGLFYNNTLISKADSTISLSYLDSNNIFKGLFHSQGGPSLLKTNLPLGDRKPLPALALATHLTSLLLSQHEKLHISVLSFYVDTVKALQKAIFQTIGNHNNVLVDTVSRIQGLTTDVAIYIIPNTVYTWTLNRRLFNVATSRAWRHTIIIVDEKIFSNMTILDGDVVKFLTALNESAYYIPFKKQESCLSLTAEPIKNETLSLDQCTEVEVCQNHKIKAVSIISSVDTDNQCSDDTVELKHSNQNTTIYKTSCPKIELKVVGKIDLSKFEKKPLLKNQKSETYVIDTNVFVDCPDIIKKINRQSNIILSAKVVDELDKLKITLSESGKKSVQQALKIINQSMGQRKIQFEIADTRVLPKDFNRQSPDNMILSVAIRYKEDKPILMTSDNGLQIKAKGMGIQTICLQDFLKSSKKTEL